MSETNGAREAIARMAGRHKRQADADGRKMSHRQAMDKARESAIRHDRRADK